MQRILSAYLVIEDTANLITGYIALKDGGRAG